MCEVQSLDLSYIAMSCAVVFMEWPCRPSEFYICNRASKSEPSGHKMHLIMCLVFITVLLSPPS